MFEKPATRPTITQSVARRRKRKPKGEMINWREFDPTAIDNGGDNSLIAELVTYKNNLDLLLERKGEYVLIKGDEIVGYYSDLASALDAGAERFGTEPALIKQIVESEPIYYCDGLAG